MIYERKINYYETDKMGVVHHSNYIRFLEEARCTMLNDLGYSYGRMEEEGVMIPVLEVNCKYKYHVTAFDTILIDVKIVEFNGVKMTVKYIVTNKENGNLVIEAETKHCFTNSNLRPINTKKEHQGIYDLFISVLETED